MQTSPAAQATPTGAPTQPMSAVPTATPAPTGSTLSQMGTVTTLNFIVIAVFALLVVIAIIYGMRQKAKRRAAAREEQARLESFVAAPPCAAEPVTTTFGQEERRPPAALRPAPANRSADLPDLGATSTPAPILAPRHDPVPAREERVAVAEAEPAVPLTRIKGLGPKVQTRLAELGVTRVDQIAALSDDEADALDAQLGAFRGRIARDRWVEQARFLAAGDVKGFEAVFGRL